MPHSAAASPSYRCFTSSSFRLTAGGIPLTSSNQNCESCCCRSCPSSTGTTQVRGCHGLNDSGKVSKYASHVRSLRRPASRLSARNNVRSCVVFSLEVLARFDVDVDGGSGAEAWGNNRAGSVFPLLLSRIVRGLSNAVAGMAITVSPGYVWF